MFHIDYRDSRPIYMQIKEQLRHHLVSGIILPDEKLPSIRDVAADLAANPNTIGRAYRELENEGYIYTITGRGSFAAHRQEIDTKRKSLLFQQFDSLVSELLFLNETETTLCKHLHKIAAQKEAFNYD